MKIDVRGSGNTYRHVKLTEGATTIDLGMLDAREQELLAKDLLTAVVDLMWNNCDQDHEKFMEFVKDNI